MSAIGGSGSDSDIAKLTRMTRSGGQGTDERPPSRRKKLNVAKSILH